MKKIITLAAVLFAAMISANSFAQIRWSATAGFGQATIAYKTNGVTVSGTDNGIYAGVLGEMPLEGVQNSMPVSLAKCRLRAFRTWGSKVA